MIEKVNPSHPDKDAAEMEKEQVNEKDEKN